jgi:hypothetical protein
VVVAEHQRGRRRLNGQASLLDISVMHAPIRHDILHVRRAPMARNETDGAAAP